MIAKSSIKKKLTQTYVIIIFVTIFIFEMIFTYGINIYYYTNIEQYLMDRMRLTIEIYDTYLGYDSLTSKAKFILEDASIPDYVNAQILDLNGRIVESSSRFHADTTITTEDFIQASKGGTAMWQGKSESTGERIMTVSAPLFNRDEIIGVIRYTTSIQAVDETVNRFLIYAYLIGIMVLMVVLKLSTLMAKRIVEPIYELKDLADHMALGNFDRKAQKYSNDEIGELAETLNYMADELLKTDRLKSDFISTISHELRTPLTSIKGWSETILTGDIANYEETQQGLEIISKEASRLHGLVENLLDFSKLEADRITLQFESVDMVQLTERVLKQFSTLLKAKGIASNLLSFEREIFVMVDRNRMRQVLINIVDNAIKHTAPGGHLWCRVTIQAEKVIISIRDDGEGIAPEHLESISEKFYKADQRQGGSGLGLAIARRIMDLHEGQLKIDSVQAQGTTVTLELPLVRTTL